MPLLHQAVSSSVTDGSRGLTNDLASARSRPQCRPLGGLLEERADSRPRSSGSIRRTSAKPQVELRQSRRPVPQRCRLDGGHRTTAPTRSRSTASQATDASATRTPATAPATTRPAGATTSAEVAAERAQRRPEPMPSVRRSSTPHSPRSRTSASGSSPSGRARPRARSPRRDRAGAAEEPVAATRRTRRRGRSKVPSRSARPPPTRRLRRRHPASASVVAPPPSRRVEQRQRAARPATGAEHHVERHVAARDRQPGGLQRLRLAAATQAEAPSAEALEGIHQGRRSGDGESVHGIGPPDDRTNVADPGRG